MSMKLVPSAEPANSMNPIGERCWYALAKVWLVRSGEIDSYIRLPGEWHGKTAEEAESRALRAARVWVDERLED